MASGKPCRERPPLPAFSLVRPSESSANHQPALDLAAGADGWMHDGRELDAFRSEGRMKRGWRRDSLAARIALIIKARVPRSATGVEGDDWLGATQQAARGVEPFSPLPPAA